MVASAIEGLLRQTGAEVLRPCDPGYTLHQDSYFSTTAAELRPAYICPTALRFRGGHVFALRSGGHGTSLGASNIEGGITLDLGLSDWTRVVDNSQSADGGEEFAALVDIGPGARWRDVYAALDKHGLMVAGGRDGSVGVGGLLLGGGISFLSGTRGFACDNVAAFEVVLADGRIVQASKIMNADLLWALKGGGNNFGIATNIRMQAVRSRPVWGGLTMMSPQTIPQAAQALVDFTSRVHEDVDSNLMCIVEYRPESKDVALRAYLVQTAGVENAPAYSRWLQLPFTRKFFAKYSFAQASGNRTMPDGYHNIWFTATFKNDPRIVSKVTSLHQDLVNTLKTTIVPDGDFVSLCLLQPLPKVIVQLGDNPMGLSRQIGDGLLVMTTVMVRTAQQKTAAHPKCKAFLTTLREFARSTDEDLNLDWEYINYTDETQDPLGSYGPENVKKLREVSQRYDPKQVFQKLCRGGFKLTPTSI
ncbi:Bifunctional solanapyrone synthase [Cytospora mali]|uniref:Bifunctional solanapyrone synthase n=1 Tax=Cytospora mali TaxID=578113 RepID=A0A194UNA9_CYTMA|nr:Bifunctional solanapyrone synthase [Valsa mali var. pyri (nom. inval.)]